MKVAVVFPAAGSGKRFQGVDEEVLPTGKNKLEQDLAGRPVFLRSIERFLNRTDVVQLILAVNPHGVDKFKLKFGDRLAFHNVKIVAGGEVERWQTVQRALEAVEEDCTHVAIHDAVRPLTSSGLIDRVFEAAAQYPAVIPACSVHSTLKKVANTKAAGRKQDDPLDAILGSAGKLPVEVREVLETVDRSQIVEVQTPQVFEAGLIRLAYAQIDAGKVDGRSITDDACLVEALGEKVYTVEGEATNLKITQPDDMQLAEAYLQKTEQSEAAQIGRKRLFAHDDDD